jgi:hypothetical protein
MMRFLTENYNARLEEMKEFCVASRLSKPLSRRLIAFHKFLFEGGCEKRLFRAIFIPQTIILPRQARAKHRESTQKRDDAFCASGLFLMRSSSSQICHCIFSAMPFTKSASPFCCVPLLRAFAVCLCCVPLLCWAGLCWAGLGWAVVCCAFAVLGYAGLCYAVVHALWCALDLMLESHATQ